MKNFKFILPFLLSASMLLAVSCKGDKLGLTAGNSRIMVSVSQPGIPAFKSAACPGTFLDSLVIEDVNGLDILVEAFESDYTDLPFQIDTKGSVVDDDAINGAGSKFIIDAWLGEENRYEPGVSEPGRVYDTSDALDYHFIKSGQAVKSTSWNLTDGSGECYIWRNAVPTTFWSYYPATVGDGAQRVLSLPGDTATDAEQKTLGFTYSIAGDALKAENQKDLLFAYNLQSVVFEDSGRLKEGSETVDIKFYHALSAIRFDISTLKEQDCSINSISLKGVAGSASCTATWDGENDALGFTWTGHDGQIVCTQDFESTDFTEESVAESIRSGGKVPNSLQSFSSGKIFFLIPQEIQGQGVSIMIGYTDASGQHTKELALNHTQPWLPGKYYTYRLSLRNIDVSVSDRVEGDRKDNIVIRNIGTETAYIRALITGYWVNAGGDIIVSNWDPEDTAVGTFTKGSGYAAWEKGTDGFYYHKAPVAAGQAASTLFTSYEVINRPSMLENDDYLEFNIVTQSVVADEGKASAIAAWGETAAAYLTEIN